MKRSVKPTRKRNTKRDLFAELSEGIDALADARNGKANAPNSLLHEIKPAPIITPQELIRVRKT